MTTTALAMVSICAIQIWQIHLDESLAVAVAERNTRAVLGLLSRGASPNATLIGRSASLETLWHSITNVRLDFKRSGGHYHPCELLPRFYEPRDDWSGVWNEPQWEPPLRENAVIVTALLDHGAHPDGTDRNGRTALFAASRLGHIQTVRSLIDHAASCNFTDSTGETPLFWAKGSIVPILVRHGANINARSYCRETALFVAIKRKDTQAAIALIENGAKVDAIDKDGWTPARCAALVGNKELLEMLNRHQSNRLIR